MSVTYERELKGILGGNPKVVSEALRRLSSGERLAYEGTRARPFLVVRAAGSLGADLVALRDDVSFLVEVKSSKNQLLHFTDSPRLTEQIRLIQTQCEQSGVLPIYAYRLKGFRGDAWRLFTLAHLALNGRVGQLYERLPRVETTTKGNHVLRWKNGMTLAAFLNCVNPASIMATRPAAPPVAA